MLTLRFLAGTSRRTSLQVPRVWSFTLDFGRGGVGSNAFLCVCLGYPRYRYWDAIRYRITVR